MEKYTFSDLMKRYNSKQSALSQFIARHKAELADHAVKTSDGWIFDAFAVGVLDRLKNYNQPILTPESVEIDGLHTTIANLQTALLTAQNQALDAQRKTIALMEENKSLASQLASMQQQLIAADQVKSDNQRLHKMLTGRIANIDTAVGKVLQTVTYGQAQNRSGWGRRGVSRKVSFVKVKKG
jgi:hypothetical protein